MCICYFLMHKDKKKNVKIRLLKEETKKLSKCTVHRVHCTLQCTVQCTCGGRKPVLIK